MNFPPLDINNLPLYFMYAAVTIVSVFMVVVVIRSIFIAFFAEGIKKRFISTLAIDYFLHNDLKHFEVVAYSHGKQYTLCRIPIARFAHRKEFLKAVLDEAQRHQSKSQFPDEHLAPFPYAEEE